MVKFICTTLTDTVDTQTYKTPKGNEYTFFINAPTEVKDKEDIKFFKSVAGGTVFKEVGIVEKVKEAVKKDLRKEYYALNKEEQVALIKKALGKKAKIPRLEKDRVELLLELHKQKKI